MHEMIWNQQGRGAAALLLILLIIGPVAGVGIGEGGFSITDLSSQPVQFIQNAGQAPELIQYQAKASDFSFDFTGDGMLVSGLFGENSTGNESEIHPLVVTLDGARSGVSIEARNQLPGHANFLIGQNESEYQRQVPWFGEIVYADILPGINLSYTGKNGILKREFQVQPGADPSQIRLKYEGAEKVVLSDNGSLLVVTRFGNLTEAAPVSYQDINGTRVNVTSVYQVDDQAGLVSFILGEYNPEYLLIIDPYLEYSTYLGGVSDDYGMDITMDSAGNAYVTGYTSSCDFPLKKPLNVNSPIRFNGTYCHNSRDVFVTKISQAAGGNATIQFSTYLGGDSSDFGRGIAVDSMQNIYITGDTSSSDFPVMLPVQNGGRLHGANDAFVTKLRADGENFWYSTYLGGNFADQANDIAVDGSNAAYITGYTVGNSPLKRVEEIYPVTSGAWQEAPNTDATMGDAFVTKLSPTGNSIEYSTYLSGKNQDVGNGIAVDGQGMAYVVGTTSSNNLVPGAAIPGKQKTMLGAQDAFLFKMNFAGTQPVYATYLGGSSGNDYGEAVAVDTAECAYVTGATASIDFPITTYAKQKKKGWQYDSFETDAFVTKFSKSGMDHEYSTYLGGTSNDWGYGIAVDNTGKAYVTGYTKSESFPKYDSMKTVTYSGDQDGFLTCVNADGSNWVYSTVFGGYKAETPRSVVVSTDGNTTLITGWTSSPSIYNLVSGDDCGNDCFPVLNWIVQDSYWPGQPQYIGGNFSGGDTSTFDAFVMKFGKSNLLPSFTANQTCNATPMTVLFTDTSGPAANIVQRIWNFGDGNATSTGSVATPVTYTYQRSGTFQATLTLISYTGSAISTPVSITACPPVVSANFTVNGYNNTQSVIDVPWKTTISFSGIATNFTPAGWQWSFEDGKANATVQNPTRQFDQVKTYNVTLTALSGTCCNSTSIRKQVRVMAPPFASFTNSTGSDRLEICVGDVVSFNDTSTGSAVTSPPTAWEWDMGDNSAKITTQNVTDHQYVVAGNFTVTLKASNVAGSHTTSIPYYVSVYGDALAGFEASPVTGTAPHTVNFTDMSTGVPVAWEWDFGVTPSVISSQRNSSYTYTQPGLYSVSLRVWSKCGASTTNTSTRLNYITVNANISPTLLFNGTSPGLLTKYNGTVPLTVFMQGNTSSGAWIDQAWWDFGDGTPQQTQTRDGTWPPNNSWVNRTHVYSVVGDYTPVLRVLNNSVTGDPRSTGLLYNQSIGVASPLNTSFTITPSSGVIGQEIQFTDTSAGSPTQWQWIFGEGSANTTGTGTPKFTYTTAGTKTVDLQVWNKYGKSGGWTNRTISITTPSTSANVVFTPPVVNMTTGANSWRKVNLVLDRADFGLSSFSIGLSLNSTNATNFGLVADRPSWIDVDKWSVSGNPVGKYQNLTLIGYDTAGRIGYGSRNVSLGNITLYGSATGMATLSLNTTSSYALYGATPLALSPVSIPVRVYQVGPILGNVNPPNDLKPDLQHDGLIDDFDGNGVVNSNDLTTFFNAITAGSLSPVAPFDYDYNGVVNTNDLIVFFNAFTQW